MASMMNNPDISAILKNPEQMKAMMDMVKNNPAMKSMLAQQTGQKPEDIEKMMGMMQNYSGYISTAYGVCTNKLVQLSLVLLVVYMIYRFFF